MHTCRNDCRDYSVPSGYPTGIDPATGQPPQLQPGVYDPYGTYSGGGGYGGGGGGYGAQRSLLFAAMSFCVPGSEIMQQYVTCYVLFCPQVVGVAMAHMAAVVMAAAVVTCCSA